MKKLAVIISIIFLMSFSSIHCFAKSSFSGGGGSRSSFSSSSSYSRSSSYSSPSKSSFSGNNTSRSSYSSSNKYSFFGGNNSSKAAPVQKTTFDTAAAKAQSRESSSLKYNEYKSKNDYIKLNTTYGAGTKTSGVNYKTVYAHSRPTGYYKPTINRTIIYRDSYDNNFMQYATMLWLFHHWNTVDKTRFDDQKRIELENKVKQLEAQGLKRDPNYSQPIYKPVDNQDDTNFLNGFLLFVIIICVIILGVIIYRYTTYGKVF